MMRREDAGHGQYVMLKPVTTLRSIYDTDKEDDLVMSRIKSGLMGLFCIEGFDALHALYLDVVKLGGELRFSDMFRTWEHQEQAHFDFITGKKKAYSPEPGFSFHQAARSFDFDIEILDESLLHVDGPKRGFALFWDLARKHGFTGVMKNRYEPTFKATEAWHWDYLGVFAKTREVHDYKTAAMVAVMDAIGNNYQGYSEEQIKYYRLQAYLLHFGFYTGAIDGQFGPKSRQSVLDFHASPPDDLRGFDRVLVHYDIIMDQTTEDDKSRTVGDFLKNF